MSPKTPQENLTEEAHEDIKKKETTSFSTSSFVEKNTDDLNSAVILSQDPAREADEPEATQPMLDSFNMTREVVVEGEEEAPEEA